MVVIEESFGIILKACKFNFVISGPGKILTETENLSQDTEAQYSLSQSFLGLETVKLNLLAFSTTSIFQ